MRDVVIPADLTFRAAHTTSFRRSVAMEIWKQDSKRRASQIKPLSHDFLSDKKELIEKISQLQMQGVISLSEDLLIVAEGCDNGHYLPFLCAALNRDGTKRIIRLFLTNGSPEIIQRAAQVGYRALRAIGSDSPEIYAGVCNAFDQPPSEMRRFRNSQNIFLPFRLGVVGSRSELKKFIEDRVKLMGRSGLCALSLLLGGEKTDAMLKKEHRERLTVVKNSNCFEYYKFLHPKVFEAVEKEFLQSQLKAADLLKDNPRGKNGEYSYLCATTFDGIEAVSQLVGEAGGEIAQVGGSEKNPFTAKTDHGTGVDMFPIIIAAAKTEC